MSGVALAAAARNLVGARFCLNGRDRATGLDCLGVLSAALAAIGHSAPFPVRSTLRRHGHGDAEAIASAAGLVHAGGPLALGDVVLVRCSPIQLHVLLAVGGERYVHAHAGLRRVVLGPREPGWTDAGRWRLAPNA
jgi:hypothetical protein